MIFHIFSIPFLPWVFHRRLFKVWRKKNEIHCILFRLRCTKAMRVSREDIAAMRRPFQRTVEVLLDTWIPHLFG